MPEVNEIVRSREQFFKPASLADSSIFCGDERRALINYVYLHVFGGVTNAAYNREILARVTGQDDLAQTFQAATADMAAEFQQLSIKAGVHSDTHSEKTSAIALDGDDPLGCGYIKLRQIISRQIAADPAKIVAEAERLRPELFKDPADTAFAHDVVKGHGLLAQNEAFFADGSRPVAKAAITEGVPTMLVDGDHVAEAGIINLRADTTIDSNEAYENNLPAYVHDAWVGEAVAPRLSKTKQYGQQQWQIAELIDTIGVMWALGVTEIAIRR